MAYVGDLCQADEPDPPPVTEAHMVAIVGWIYEERKAGWRKIGALSIPQLVSTVRQRQLAELGVSVP